MGKLKLSFLVLLACFSILLSFVPPVLAQESRCNLRSCIPDEGYCQEGAVMECQEQREKCENGQWVPTEEQVNNLCTYNPMGPEMEFQNAINSPGYNRQKHVLGILQDTALAISFALGNTPTTENNGNASGRNEGAISMIANLTAMLYSTQPASSIEYLADLGSHIGLTKPVYAQGLGWTAFSPVLSLWKTFRNIAYLAFIIIFVVIGFMIMFRTKINPQTVISVQNALPKIIITLLLITFSYAIAGFIIDLSQLTTKIIGNTFQKTGLIAIPRSDSTKPEQLNKLYNANIFQLLRPLTDTTELKNALYSIGLGEAGIQSTGTNIERGTLSWLGAVTVQLVFVLMAFFLLFKVFFALLGPYISIVLSIIFAPLQLLFGVFKHGSFIGWLKSFLANIAVFPVTWTMLCLAAVFRSGPDLNALPSTWAITHHWLLGSADWSTQGTPFIINFRPVPGIGNWGKAVGSLIAFGILFTIPKVAELVKGALEGKQLPIGAIAGEEIKTGFKKFPGIGSLLP